LIYKPWIFGGGGVGDEPIQTGLTWTVWSTEVERYNLKPMKVAEAFVDLTATDNVAIDFNTYLTLQILEGKTPILHEKFGNSWYSNNIVDFFRTVVRNEGRTHSSIALRTKPGTIELAQSNIKAKVSEYIKKIEVPIRVVKVVIGKVVPPDEVLKEAERTAAQKQREQTEKSRANTELIRKHAEKNKALADKAYAKEFRMTTNQFLKNKELDIMEMAVKKGGENMSLIMNASGATPIFSVKK